MFESVDVSTNLVSPSRHHRRRPSVVIPLGLLQPLPPDNQPPVVCHHHRCPSGSMPCNKKCWATLLTCPSYLPGVILLNHSLLKHKSQYPLLILTTPSFPQTCIAVLDALGIQHRRIEPLYPEQQGHFLASQFEDTWTKLRVFELVEYETIVLLDADMLVRRNMDELFEVKLPGTDWIAASHACVTNASWASDLWWVAPRLLLENLGCAYTDLQGSTELYIYEPYTSQCTYYIYPSPFGSTIFIETAPYTHSSELGTSAAPPLHPSLCSSQSFCPHIPTYSHPIVPGPGPLCSDFP